MAGGLAGPATPGRAQSTAEWQSRVHACVSPSGLPDTPQLRGRHLMAKVEETTASSSQAQLPRCPLAASHKWVVLLKVQELFPGWGSRLPRPRQESVRRRRAAARLPSLHLTWRPQPGQPFLAAPSPLPAALLASSSREGGGGEGRRRQRAGSAAPSPWQVSKQ